MAKNGILLTGGNGTRLLPITKVFSKHMLPVNGKFIIDYPIDTLKQIGCEDVIVVVGGTHYDQIISYLGDGSQYGMNFSFIFQSAPLGIAQAINLCKKFVYDDSDFTVCLADNFFEKPLKWNNPKWKTNPRAQIMLSDHYDLKRFGVASLNDDGNIVKVEEKPKKINSKYKNYAVSGLYLFTPQYFEFFEQLKPSLRGEYEISEIIQMYLDDNNLSYSFVDGLWSDLGTHESIAYVNNYFFNKNKPEGNV